MSVLCYVHISLWKSLKGNTIWLARLISAIGRCYEVCASWTLNKLQLRKLSQWSGWHLRSGLPANEFSSKYLDCIFFQPTICFQINPHCLVQMWYLEQFCYFVGRVYLSGEINVNCFSISSSATAWIWKIWIAEL